MTETLTPEELLRLRMRALGVGLAAAQSGSGEQEDASAAVAATASRMLAVQGQDWRSARWALGARTPGATVEDVHAAFQSGRIVRSWPMRGTIHVVAAEDIGWLQAATNHRVLAGAPKRRAHLGIDDATLDRLVDVSMAVIRAGSGAGAGSEAGAGSGPGVDRDALSAAWTEAGIEWQSSWRYHLIWWLCQNGLATFGPVREGGEPLLVDAATWIAQPRRLAGDEALAELAARYAGARGPVREKDLAWWSGLTATEARRGIAAAHEQGRLAPARLEGANGKAGELWAAPAALAERGAAGGARDVAETAEWLLLPSFDEHLLGYTIRDAQLDPEHFERIVPGRNGMFLATVVRDGRVVGTWRRGARKSAGIEVSPFPGERITAAQLGEEAARWAAFHGLEELPVVVT